MAERSDIQRLGTVSVPSGTVIVLDFGLLRLWSDDRPPIIPEGVAEPSVVERANRAVDLTVSGPDASVASRLVNLAAARGPFVFDYPPESVPELRTRLDTEWRARGLEASLDVLDRRLPHAERARRLLEISPEGTEVPFNGIWAVAARGVPAGRPFDVLGQRMESGSEYFDRWWSVWLQVEPDLTPVTSVEIGYVLVDEARLLFADLEALRLFRSDVSTDGKADVAFWGGDATDVAARLQASILPEGDAESVFGWQGLPGDQALEIARTLHAIRTDEHLRFAFDFRPHDHHFELLSQARKSPQGSGTLDLGEARVCGFFTSWGDGAFPVYRDLAADGRLVRLRVELGADATVERQRALEERWFGASAKLALVSARVARDNAPIGYLYREAPDHDDDSGWRIFAGDESQAYLDDPNNATVLPLRDVIDHDRTLESILGTSGPAAFERRPSGEFARVENP